MLLPLLEVIGNYSHRLVLPVNFDDYAYELFARMFQAHIFDALGTIEERGRNLEKALVWCEKGLALSDIPDKLVES